MKRVRRYIYTYKFSNREKLIINSFLSVIVLITIMIVGVAIINYAIGLLPLFNDLIRESLNTNSSPEFNLMILLIGFFIIYFIFKLATMVLFEIMDFLTRQKKELKEK